MSSIVTQELKARFQSIVDEPNEVKAHSLIEFLNNHATSITPDVIKQLDILIPEEMSHHDIFSIALIIATETMSNPDDTYDKGASLMDAIAQVLYNKARDSAELAQLPDLNISVDEDDDNSFEDNLANLDLNIFHLPEFMSENPSSVVEKKRISSTPPNKPLPSPPKSGPPKKTLPKLDKSNNQLDYGAHDAIVTNMIEIFNRQMTLGTDGVDKRVVDVQHYGDIARGILASQAIQDNNLISFLNLLAVMRTDNRVEISDAMVQEKQTLMIKALIEADEGLECFTQTNWAAMAPWLDTLEDAHKSMIENAYKAKKNESTHRNILTYLSDQTKKGNDHHHMLEPGRSLRQTMADVEAVSSDIASQSRAIFAKFNPSEFYNKQWENDATKQHAGLEEMIQWFNQLSAKVIHDIVNAPTQEAMVKRYEFYTRLCKSLFDKGDYNSALAIRSGLFKDAINRLNLTEQVSNDMSAIVEENESRFDSSKNFANLRAEYKAKHDSGEAYIPVMGKIIQDFTFIDDGNPTQLNQKFNVEKWALNNNSLEEVASIQKNILPVLAKELDSTTSYTTDFVHDVKHSTYMSEKEAYDTSLAAFPRGGDGFTIPESKGHRVKTVFNTIDNALYRAVNTMGKAFSTLVEKAKQLADVVANKVGHIFKSFKTRATGWVDRKITQANVVNAYSTAVRKKKRILNALNQREAEIGVEHLLGDEQHNQLVEALNSEQVKIDKILRDNPNWHPREGLSAEAAHDFINGLREIATTGACENINFTKRDGKWIYADKYCFSLSEQDCDEISVFLEACEYTPSASYYETQLANAVATSSSRRGLINQLTRQIVYPDAKVLSGLNVKSGLSLEQVSSFYDGLHAVVMNEERATDIMAHVIEDDTYVFQNRDIDFSFHMDEARKSDAKIIADVIDMLDQDKAVQNHFMERFCNIIAFDRSYKQFAKDLYAHCMAVNDKGVAKLLEPLTKDSELDQSIKGTLSVSRDRHASSDDLNKSHVRNREQGTTPELDRKRPKNTNTSK